MNMATTSVSKIGPELGNEILTGPDGTRLGCPQNGNLAVFPASTQRHGWYFWDSFIWSLLTIYLVLPVENRKKLIISL